MVQLSSKVMFEHVRNAWEMHLEHRWDVSMQARNLAIKLWLDFNLLPRHFLPDMSIVCERPDAYKYYLGAKLYHSFNINKKIDNYTLRDALFAWGLRVQLDGVLEEDIFVWKGTSIYLFGISHGNVIKLAILVAINN